MSTAEEVIAEPFSRKRLIQTALFGLASFLVFLSFKLPQAKIQNLVLAHIRIFAQEQGFSFSAETLKIGILLGPSVKVYNAEIRSLDNDHDVMKVPFLKIRPALLPFLFGTQKVSFLAELKNGSVSGTVSSSASRVAADVDVDSIRLEELILLKRFVPLDLQGKVDGSVQLDLNLASPDASDGKVELRIKQLSAPAQAFMGFSLPQIKVSDTLASAEMIHGKAVLKTFNLGKDLLKDDLVARATGDFTVDRLFANSRVNAKVQFEISPRVKSSFPILDALLSNAKGADGKYAYHIGGTVSSLEALPGQ